MATFVQQVPALCVVLHHTVHHQNNTLSINVQKLDSYGAPVGSGGVDIDDITAEEFGVPDGVALADYATCERLCNYVAGLEGAPPAVLVATPELVREVGFDAIARQVESAETVEAAVTAARTQIAAFREETARIDAELRAAKALAAEFT